MKRRKRNTGLVIVLVITFLFMGIIAGILIDHYFGKEEPPPQIVYETVKNVTNVYFPKRDIVYGEVPRNSYNEDNYRIEDGFMAYYDDDGNKISHLGIDVSYHNESIDFEKLKETPLEFMMVRCGYRGYTEGGLVEDSKFKEYAGKCNENGIALGVYFYTQAITEEEAVAEAEYVINLIKDFDISYPVVFDTEKVEDPQARTNLAELSKEELSQICIAFCERIKRAGYYPMIYCSENWMRRSLDYTMLQQYDLWAAQYLDKNDYLYDFTIWQYTAEGEIPGVKGEVDLDISMVDYASFVPAIQEAMKTEGEISTYDSEESQDR